MALETTISVATWLISQKLNHHLYCFGGHQVSPAVNMTEDRSKRYEKIDFLGEGQV